MARRKRSERESKVGSNSSINEKVSYSEDVLKCFYEYEAEAELIHNQFVKNLTLSPCITIDRIAMTLPHSNGELTLKELAKEAEKFNQVAESLVRNNSHITRCYTNDPNFKYAIKVELSPGNILFISWGPKQARNFFKLSFNFAKAMQYRKMLRKALRSFFGRDELKLIVCSDKVNITLIEVAFDLFGIKLQQVCVSLDRARHHTVVKGSDEIETIYSGKHKGKYDSVKSYNKLKEVQKEANNYFHELKHRNLESLNWTRVEIRLAKDINRFNLMDISEVDVNFEKFKVYIFSQDLGVPFLEYAIYLKGLNNALSMLPSKRAKQIRFTLDKHRMDFDEKDINERIKARLKQVERFFEKL